MSRIKKSFLKSVLCLLALGSPALSATQPQLLMGSGNIGDGYTSAMVDCKINSLLNFNAPSTRLTTSSFFNGSTPSPQTLDWVVQKTSAAGIRGMLLFDYYLSQGPMGTYGQWYAIGAAYAARFRPNSAWMTANTANPALGITLYQAFNEPDNTAFGPQIPTTQYHDGLQGLADGIHSVDPTLKVFPGGYSRPNAQNDYTCGGYCTAVTDLLNNGTLAGIDLHTYFGFWTPVSNWNTSSQHNFDAVKSVCGVTRDIDVCVTESGYGVTGAEGGSTPTAISEATSAGYNLTVLWDGLGIVGNAGQSVSQITHSFTLVLEDPTSAQPDLAFTTSQCPWVPNPRGQMIQLVANLTQGMSFISLLPKSRGEYILTGPGRNKKMWVWQDRSNWTNIGGTSYNVTGIPSGVVGLEVYGAAGLITGYPITVQTSYNVTGLPVANTYMFVAVGGSPTPTPSATQSATPTPSATATPSCTVTQTLSASATPTITQTPSVTATLTDTPVFSPTATPTITLTPTPGQASPTATPIAGLQQGALKALARPNPNPQAIRLLLGPGVDTVALRCSSVGYSTVGVERQPIAGTGWMDVHPSVLARLPNGVFYLELWGEKSGKMVGERVLCKVMVLR